METSSARPLALVTGASSGIGLELAKQFAEHDFDLILAAEDEELAAAARALGEAVRGSVQVDLAGPDGVEELWRRVTATGRPLAVAALNAGIGAGGAFADNDLAKELRMIDLNVRSTVHLAKYGVRGMVGRGAGPIPVTCCV